MTADAGANRAALWLVVWAGVVFGYAASCVLGGPASDEGFHAHQIWHYYVGGNEPFDTITTPTFYHQIIASVMNLIGYYHDYLLRLVNLLVALCLLPVFYCMVRRYRPPTASARTAQLLFAPLIFPYYFLVYTDLWALLLIALSFLAVFERRPWLAGLFGFGAVLIRQDAIIWLGLAYLYMATEHLTLSRPFAWRAVLRDALLRGAVFLALFGAFIGFVLINGGVAIGDSGSHPMMRFNLSNLYGFLFCAWLLFLPLCLQQLPRIVRLLRRPWVWGLLLAACAFYMSFYANEHGYNRTHYTFFVHNGWLHLLEEYLWLRGLLFVPMAWMALTLAVMPYPDRRCYWLLLIAPLAVVAHPMVDPRYYFPAYLLINLWRPALPQGVELATLAGYIPLAAFVMYGTVTGLFFL